MGVDELKISLDGSGDIESDGVMEVNGSATIDLEGSGDVDLSLKAEKVMVELDGSGDIDLNDTSSTLKAIFCYSIFIHVYFIAFNMN